MSFASLLELDLTVKLFELLGPVGTAALDVASRQHLHSIHEPWPKEGDHELGTELVAFCEPSRSRRPKPTGAGLFVSRATVTTMKLNQAWGAARKTRQCQFQERIEKDEKETSGYVDICAYTELARIGREDGGGQAEMQLGLESGRRERLGAALGKRGRAQQALNVGGCPDFEVQLDSEMIAYPLHADEVQTSAPRVVAVDNRVYTKPRLALRGDSRLCSGYIQSGVGDINDIVATMVEMDFYFCQTSYPQERERVLEEIFEQARNDVLDAFHAGESTSVNHLDYVEKLSSEDISQICKVRALWRLAKAFCEFWRSHEDASMDDGLQTLLASVPVTLHERIRWFWTFAQTGNATEVPPPEVCEQLGISVRSGEPATVRRARLRAQSAKKQSPNAVSLQQSLVVFVLTAWRLQESLRVLRDGKEVQIAVPTVVAGDIVVLGVGDVVPADLRLFEAKDFKVSEMALTGEPDDVTKTSKVKEKKEGPEKLTPETMAFSGCSVTSGAGRGLVTDTGMGTRIGRIAKLIAGDEGPKTTCFCFPDTSGNQTPLQQSLNKLGARIGILAIIICVGIFIIGWVTDRKDPTNPDSAAWLYMILISVTLAVAAIPEGIPLCVTISLSIGCSDMVEQEVLVRKIAAVETLGSASVICSDKTGTLTEGKMTMVGMYAAGVTYEVTGKGFDPEVGQVQRLGSTSNAGKDMGVKSNLLTAILCCNTTLSKEKDEEGVLKWTPKGNSSEAPIVVAARKVGLSETIASEYPRALEVPFSSSRKMMLTVSKVKGTELCAGGMPLPPGTQYLTVCKGAPNYIVELCKEQLKEDGSVGKMTEEDKKKIYEVVDGYSAKALRVLAIAARPMSSLPYDESNEDISTDQKFEACRKDLRLIGLVASIDPERDGVPQSVLQARGAGIRVVMITGDYLLTAIAIAKNVNILQQEDDEEVSAMDCARLRPDGEYLDNSEMDKLTSSVRVFARAKPEDKLEIVKSIQRQGQVAAMTGDGVNDAPALNQADIGVAMGIQGTEVAKGASDMVLTDDNFCSIVKAVEKGRSIYSGIQKFVAFIMSVHIAEVMQIFLCIVVGIPVMRTPLQILFLILVTDLPPSIALGMEPGEADILEQRPRPKEEPIVLNWMWLAMVMNGGVLTLVIVGVYLVSLINYCEGEILQVNIGQLEGTEGVCDAAHRRTNDASIITRSLVQSGATSSRFNKLRDEAEQSADRGFHLLGVVREHPGLYLSIFHKPHVEGYFREQAHAEGHCPGTDLPLCGSVDSLLVRQDPRPPWLGDWRVRMGAGDRRPCGLLHPLRGMQDHQCLPTEAVPGFPGSEVRSLEGEGFRKTNEGLRAEEQEDDGRPGKVRQEGLVLLGLVLMHRLAAGLLQGANIRYHFSGTGLAGARAGPAIVDVLICTAEVPDRQMHLRGPRTKGWQTARFCDFPQEIGLQFETPVHLRQVQFLSHQSKIATKIDLYTAMPAAGQASTYDGLSFKRLGYLSLDSNERSQFQARELKSVYVDVSAQYMKILFHKCHVNRYNIVNQVGLIALNCLGEALGPDLAMGPPPPNPALARGPTNGYQPPQASSPPPPQPSVQDAAQAAADEMRYDAQTLERIRSLSNAKARAVDAEDYEEAKRCKEMLARLRQTGLLLRELEDRKKAAVQNEDYDAAKALKSEIDRLRSAIERPEVRAERPHSGRSARSNSLGPNSRAGAGSPDFASHHSAPRGGHQPQMVPLSQDSEAVTQAPPSRGKRSPSPSLPAFPLEEGYQADVPRREAANSPPLPAAGGARVARTPPLSGMASARSAPKELPPEQPPLSERGFDAADHPLSGVPNVEDLSQPEPLNSNFQKEAEPLIQLFGEYLTNCVYSKAWSLRDAALQKLTLDLQNGEHQSTDQSRLLAGYVIVLKRMVPDKNVQVFLAAAALLHTVCQELLGRSGPRRAEAHSALDPLMPLLVDRLGDSNALFLDRWGSWGHGSFSETAAESTGAPSCLHGVVCRSVLARSTYGLCSVGGVEWRRRLLGLAERDGANFASGTVSAAQPAAWGSFLRFHEVASGNLWDRLPPRWLRCSGNLSWQRRTRMFPSQPLRRSCHSR
eukprot:s548_g35.t1